jgi:hypothetical protein
MRSGPEATLRLLENLEHRFAGLAASSLPILVHHIALAGQVIRLKFVGPALVERIMPSLAHLAIEDDGEHHPDLTIHLWDAQSTSCALPPSPWTKADFEARRQVAGANGPGYRVAYDLYCGVFSLTALDRKTAYWWAPDADKLPIYESAAPLREILQAWFEDRAGIIAHAAAIGNEDGAILLVGRGGSGKSTTALACVGETMQLIGEDYCLLTQSPEIVTVHSLYASAKLSDHSLQLLPQFQALVQNPRREEGDKAVLFTHRAVPMQAAGPVRAIVLPRLVDEGETRLARVSAMRALMALAPSSILQLSGMGQGALEMFRLLAAQTPTYALDLRGHPSRARALLEGLL